MRYYLASVGACAATIAIMLVAVPLCLLLNLYDRLVGKG